jgi:hypothetical protein
VRYRAAHTCVCGFACAQVIQIGLNTLREVFSRAPLVLEEEGMQDLVHVRVQRRCLHVTPRPCNRNTARRATAAVCCRILCNTASSATTALSWRRGPC